jgi:hypothetical protein
MPRFEYIVLATELQNPMQGPNRLVLDAGGEEEAQVLGEGPAVNPPYVLRVLRQLGGEGWEFITIETQQRGTMARTLYWLKREMDDLPDEGE